MCVVCVMSHSIDLIVPFALVHRAVVAILDAFHFDLSFAMPLGCGKNTNTKGTGEEKQEGEVALSKPAISVETSGNVVVAMDTGKEKNEVEEEGNEEDHGEGEEEVPEVGLGVEELKKLAQRIHDNIVRTIIPRLQAVLTKQVLCVCVCVREKGVVSFSKV